MIFKYYAWASYATHLNPRQSISALTCGGACASHGNPDVRNDLVELIALR